MITTSINTMVLHAIVQTNIGRQQGTLNETRFQRVVDQGLLYAPSARTSRLYVSGSLEQVTYVPETGIVKVSKIYTESDVNSRIFGGVLEGNVPVRQWGDNPLLFLFVLEAIAKDQYSVDFQDAGLFQEGGSRIRDIMDSKISIYHHLVDLSESKRPTLKSWVDDGNPLRFHSRENSAGMSVFPREFLGDNLYQRIKNARS